MLSRSSVYTLIAIAVLIILFAAVSRGASQSAKVTAEALDSSKILGMMNGSPDTSNTASFVDTLIHSGTENAKGLAAQKVTEVKTAMVENLKKEVTKLTDAQVKQLTTQLCSEWGVISLSPTLTPTP